MSLSIEKLLHDIPALQQGNMLTGIAEGSDAALTPAVAYTAGMAFAKWLCGKLNCQPQDCIIGVGYDVRHTSKDLQVAMMKGMLDAGIYVSDCDLSSSPAMFMSTIYHDTQYDGACMITGGTAASDVNGIRFFARGSVISAAGVGEILAIANELIPELDEAQVNAPLDEANNRFTDLSILSLYAANLCFALSDAIETESYYDDPLANFHIILDASNGVGGFLAEDVLEAMGANLEGSCNLEADGDFPAHLPDPSNTDLCKQLAEAVAAQNADLGIIMDSEGAHLTAVLKNGTILNSDSIAVYLEVNDPQPVVPADPNAEPDPLEKLKKIYYPEDGIHQLIKLIAYLAKK